MYTKNVIIQNNLREENGIMGEVGKGEGREVASRGDNVDEDREGERGGGRGR